MNSGARRISTWLLPWLLMLTGCTEPVVVTDEPAEVETCEWLVPVGIELVNDYFYTLLETDLGVTGGDPDLLPTSIVALNTRGAQLDQRAAELECDLEELNTAIVAATAGLESVDPLTAVFLETVRAGVVQDNSPVGSWLFVSADSGGDSFSAAFDQEITLSVAAGGAVTGDTGCNQYFFEVDLTAGAWQPTELNITAAECAPESWADAQQAYVSALSSVDGFLQEDDRLTLGGPGVELHFSRTTEELSSAGD